jgi:TP901 family phage tail tape measure protein
MADELKVLISTGMKDDGSVKKLQAQLDAMKKGVAIPVTLQISNGDQANLKQITSSLQNGVRQSVSQGMDAGVKQASRRAQQSKKPSIDSWDFDITKASDAELAKMFNDQQGWRRENAKEDQKWAKQSQTAYEREEKAADAALAKAEAQRAARLKAQQKAQAQQQEEQRKIRAQEDAAWKEYQSEPDRQKRSDYEVGGRVWKDEQKQKQSALRDAEREAQQVRREVASGWKDAEKQDQQDYDARVKVYEAAQAKMSRMNSLKASHSELQAGGKLEGQFRELYKNFGNVTPNADDAASQLADYTSQLNLLEAQLAKVNTQQVTFSDGLVQAGQSLASKFLSYESLSKMLGTFYNNLVKVNSAAVDLSVVTGTSGKELESYTKQAAQNAKDLSLGVADYITGTTMAARLGYNLQDSSELSETFNIYDKLAPDVKGVEDASKSIINAMKAFNIDASDAIGIVDKYVDVGNKYALSSGDIGAAMQRSAASLAAAGDTMDEGIGLIVGMTEINQDATRTGAALKTLSARLRGAKAELVAAGEDTDGMAESTSKLRTQIMALTNLDGTGGFDIMDEKGGFKSTYEMMKGIAKAYNQMDASSPNAAALLELIAGKNRASDVAGLLKNFSQAEKAYETAQESSGVAMKNYDKYQKSLEARSNKTKSIVENLSLNVLDDGKIGTLYDGLNGLLEIIVKISEKTQGIPTIAAAATAAITKFAPGLNAFGTAKGLNGENITTGLWGKLALGQESGFLGIRNYSSLLTEQLKSQEQTALGYLSSSGSMEEMLNNFRVAGATEGGLFAEIANNLDAVSGSAENARQYITTLSASMQSSVKAGGAFGKVLKGIGTSLLNWGASMAVTALLSWGLDALDKFVNRAKYAQEALDSMSSKFKENSNDLKKSDDLIQQYGERYEQLAKHVDRKTNRNLGLSEEEYQEYLNIVNALGDSGLNIKIGTDINGNALLSLGTSMNGLSASMDGLKGAYEQQAAEDRKEILSGDQMKNLADTELFQSISGSFDSGYVGGGGAAQLGEKLQRAISDKDSEQLYQLMTAITEGNAGWLDELGIDSEQLKEKSTSAWNQAKATLGDAKVSLANWAAEYLEDNLGNQLRVSLDSQAAQRWAALSVAREKAQAAIEQGMYENPKLWANISDENKKLIASLPTLMGEDFYFKEENGRKTLLTDEELPQKAQEISNGLAWHPEALDALTQLSDQMNQWVEGTATYNDLFSSKGGSFWGLQDTLIAAFGEDLGKQLAGALRPSNIQQLMDQAGSHLDDASKAWDMTSDQLSFAATQLSGDVTNLSWDKFLDMYYEYKAGVEKTQKEMEDRQKQTLTGQWAALEAAQQKAEAYTGVLDASGKIVKDKYTTLDAREQKAVLGAGVLGGLKIDKKAVAQLQRENAGDNLVDGVAALAQYETDLADKQRIVNNLREKLVKVDDSHRSALEAQVQAAEDNVEAAQQDVNTQRLINLQNARAGGAFQQLTDEGQIAVEQANTILSLVQDFNASGTIDWEKYGDLTPQESSAIFHQDASGYWYADEMAARQLIQQRYQKALTEGQAAYNKLLEDQKTKRAEIVDLQDKADASSKMRLEDARKELSVLQEQTKAAKLYVDTIKQGAEGKFNFSAVSGYGENGDDFRTNQQAIEALNSLWEKKQIYTNKGKAYADYLFGSAGADWRSWSQGKYEQVMKKVGAYNNEGELDASAFYRAAEKAGLFKNLGNGSFSLAPNVTLDDFRNKVLGGYGSDQYIMDILNAFSEVTGVMVDLKNGALALREVGDLATDNKEPEVQTAELATIEASNATINAATVVIDGDVTGEKPSTDTKNNAEPATGSAVSGASQTATLGVNVQLDTGNANQEQADLQGNLEKPATKPVNIVPNNLIAQAQKLNSILAAPISKSVALNVSGAIPSSSGLGPLGGLLPGASKPSKVDGGVSAGGNTLVGELAPEIIVSRKTGTWRLASYPQLTRLERGDIVFNGKQTEQILSGRKDVPFGKSYVGGAGFSFIKYYSDQNGYRRSKGRIPDDPPRGGGGKGGRKPFSWDDILEKWEDLYDWIPKALELAKKATTKLTDIIAEKIGDVMKNKAVDEAIASNKKQIDLNNKAYDRYMQQADKAQREMQLSNDIVDRIQHGTIDINEYDDDMKKRIENYKTWYEKAEACLETVEELKKQEKELALQKLTNITDYYEKKADRLEAILDENSAQLDYKAATGQEIVETDYDKSLSATQKKIDLLVEARNKYDQQFQALLAEGVLTQDSDEWHEYVANLEKYDQDIIQAKTDLSELVDTINNIDLTKLQYAYQSMSDLQSLMEAYMSFHSSQGTDATDEQYNALIRNGMDQIQNLQQQNAMLLQQQSGLDVLSEKWQDLQNQIIGNENEIWSIKSAQEEWNDAIADLRIDRLQQEREELERTNDQYQRRKDLQDAQEEYERARTQRTKLIFRDGQGYVYENDQKALKDAQDKLDDLRHKETLAKIDDAIQAIEDQKKTNNIYDYSGQNVIGSFTNEQGSTLYGLIRDTAAINGMKATGMGFTSEGYKTAGANGGVTIQIGDIVLQDVQDADTLAQELIQKLPNKVLQAMYRK